MSEHTPEPWAIAEAFGGLIPIWSRVKWITNIHAVPEESSNNARRIVACVNACAGIPTETLENAKAVIEFTKQKDHDAEILCAAADRVQKVINVGCSCKYGCKGDRCQFFATVRAAIMGEEKDEV